MRVVIIGGGLSGTALCLRLLRDCPTNVHITLVERRAAQLNRGVAYSAQVHQQLLNVPAGRMGMFAEEPGGFLEWLQEGVLPATDGAAFIDRHTYGDHIEALFQQLRGAHPSRSQVRIGEAVSARRDADGTWHVTLAEGDAIVADRLVLALGNAHPAHVPGLSPEAMTHAHYAPWPWQHGLLRRIAPDEHVLFVGSGLTMVDLLLSMEQQGHRGSYTVLSRRGQLPRPHAASVSWTAPAPPQDERGHLGALVRWVREELRRANDARVPWQSVMDAVRPYAQTLWQGLDHAERGRFLRHVRPLWEIHRHRMPRPAHEKITALIAAGRLTIIAGRVLRVEVDGATFRITHSLRGAEETHTLHVDRVINCTGPQSDVRRLDQPLLRDLLAQGDIVADPLGLGIDCVADGSVRDANGDVRDDLFVLGPLCKGVLWECTAVPEIRGQVRTLVARHFMDVPQPA